MNGYSGEYYADGDDYYPGDEEDDTVTDANPTLAQRVEEDGISLTLEVDYDLAGTREEFLPHGHHYIATLSRELPDDEPVVGTDPRRYLKVPYSTGSGWTREPTAAEVLESLLSEASTVEDTGSFEEWADEMGYDADSRTAERSYIVCRDNRDDLMAFLGTERYQAYLWETERG